MFKHLAIAALCAGGMLCTAQPVISSGGVLHAGSYAATIAPGSLFVIFGTGLGPAVLQQANQYPLATTYNGTSVRVTVGGQSWQAPIAYTSAGQVGAILPSSTSIGTASVAVTYNGQTSAGVAVQVARTAFGAFTVNSQGTGTAVVQNFVSASQQPINSLDNSATPGQVVTLWGTGLGAGSGADDAPSPGSLSGNFQVIVGGQEAKLLYAGRSGCCAGVDQIVFEVPQNLNDCHVPIEVRSEGAATSQIMTLAVSRAGGLCSSGLSPDDIEKARSQGHLKVGSLLLIRYSVGDQQSFDYGYMTFSDAPYQQLVKTSRNIAGVAPGSCEVATYDASGVTGGISGIGTDFFENYLIWASGSPLDAGERINAAGNGRTVSFNRLTPGFYSNFGYDPTNPGSFGGFLSPGTYTIDNGSGSGQIPGFRTNITVPQAPRFTGNAQVSIPRGRDYVVRWSGGSSDERVLLYGYSYSINPFALGVFTCVGRGNANTFTIPASVLSKLPASTMQGFGYLAMYSLSSFQRSSVSGLDAFYAGLMNMSFQSATFE